MFVTSVKYCLQIALLPPFYAFLPTPSPTSPYGFISCEVHFGQGDNLWKKMPKWQAACRQEKKKKMM